MNKATLYTISWILCFIAFLMTFTELSYLISRGDVPVTSLEFTRALFLILMLIMSTKAYLVEKE